MDVLYGTAKVPTHQIQMRNWNIGRIFCTKYLHYDVT